MEEGKDIVENEESKDNVIKDETKVICGADKREDSEDEKAPSGSSNKAKPDIDSVLKKTTLNKTKPDVPVSTIVKMMGLATSLELKTAEGKLDLLTSKIGTLTAKVERLTEIAENLPSVGDIEQIEATLLLLKDAILGDRAKRSTEPEESATKEKVRRAVSGAIDSKVDS